MEFVFDRTQKDYEYALELRNKIYNNGWDSLTSEEKEEWRSCTLKGAYNYTDRNRVENAVKEINQLLIDNNYMSEVLEIIEDRDISTLDYKDSVDRYLSNIQKLIDNFYVLDTTPELPNTLDNLVIEKANDIEKILYDINRTIMGMTENFKFSDDVYAGEGYFS